MQFDDKKKADEIFSLFGSLGVEDQRKVMKKLLLSTKDKGGNNEMEIKL